MGQTEMLNRLNELPRIKALLQEILEMVNQEEVDFGALAKKLSMDQVLTARLLRMANSAHFAGNKTISTVNDALIRVGIGAVKTLVVASVLSSVFSGVKTLDMEKYWEDTFEVSVIASQLAVASGLDKNEAFTIGVLHNMGELMIHTLVPEQAVLIQEKVKSGMNPWLAQREILETTSPALGGKLASSWKFPDSMTDAIEHYDNPVEATKSQKYAMLIHFARDINEAWDTFISEQQKALFLAEHPDSRVLNISAAFVAKIDQHRGEGMELAHQMAAA
ncbi:HDOD domain-containing protein [Vibrio sp.]|uniref:HDOD domain-containing protein n=1 Tax=Vibrio viridaestus TaxID=2487322 RepID=A0A3N9TKM2_9VIBR|nr:HDOD domain-containing protein [Vibrio viridaestus]MDC0612668.1 HDOD domain-containing protein [Vibrio sp.]RQW64938.1 HDOD domain-containing protein [Vibrio viridaestus]